MKLGLKRIAVRVLAVIGAGVLVLAAAFCVLGAVHAHRNQHPRPEDLLYVLNWAELRDARPIEVVHSYASTGLHPDGVRAYCIRLDKPLSGLEERNRQVWMRGPVTESLLVEGIRTAATFSRHDAPWFPAEEELNSERFVLSFPHLTAYHGRVQAVDLTAYDTKDHLLYHAEVRW